MGTNEIPKAGDGGMRDAGDNNVGRLRDETQSSARDIGSGNLDAARSACEAKCGPMNNWMSMSENPQGFQKATDDIKAKSPEEIKQALQNNDVQIKAVQAFTDGLKAKIEAVKAAQAAQEALVNKQRGQ